MVGSFDDKVKVWVIFHISVFFLSTRSSGKTTIYFGRCKNVNCLYRVMLVVGRIGSRQRRTKNSKIHD